MFFGVLRTPKNMKTLPPYPQAEQLQKQFHNPVGKGPNVTGKDINH